MKTKWPFSLAIFWFKSHSMHLLSLQSDCHPCDPDARWLSTFLVSQVHRSLPPIVSGRRLGGDVDVNFPDDRSLLFLSLAAPTVPLPGWAKLLHLNPTNYQQVPSAAQRESEITNQKMQVQHYSLLLCCFIPHCCWCSCVVWHAVVKLLVVKQWREKLARRSWRKVALFWESMSAVSFQS